MIEREWRVRVSAAAKLDWGNILLWTRENFGPRQSHIYRDTLMQAIRELRNGPDPAGSKSRDEIMQGVRVVHVARRGRRGRHFLLYRVVEPRTIEIARILHDSMDLKRHLPSPSDDGET